MKKRKRNDFEWKDSSLDKEMKETKRPEFK